MRSVYLETKFELGGEYDLEGRAAHHLLNVVRVKQNETILGLNGEGVSAKLLIQDVNKKSISFKAIEVISHQRKMKFDLFIGKLKKDALDLSLKQATELGISTIYIVETEFSQRYRLNLERIDKLLISAMEQSNNPFKPEIKEVKAEEVEFLSYDKVLCFTMDKEQARPVYDFSQDQKVLLVIGPEGGLSILDQSLILNSAGDKLAMINLPTYILRASTAVPTAVGYALR